MKTQKVKIENGKLPTFSIEVGTAVIWENADSVAHQLNSDPSNVLFKFDVGIIFPGENSSPVIFNVKSDVDGIVYGCGLVPDLAARIFVGVPVNEHQHGNGHGHGGHHNGEHESLKHFHGFVTNGKSGDRIYMTHTPIFSDERHHFQIILQSAFTDPTHIEAYNNLRDSSYGNGKVQLFFDHLALIDIESKSIKELTVHSLRYYPDVPTVREGLVMPSVSTVLPGFEGAIVRIENILHFRTFDPNMDYPEHLTYLMYGNQSEVFIDHFISRAPNFHSVAKLNNIPSFWKQEYFDTTLNVMIPGRAFIDVSPKIIKRAAFVDNLFHLIWGLPSGAISPSDPLERTPLNNNGLKEFEAQTETGEIDILEIEKFLHFDATRLLNDGLGFE